MRVISMGWFCLDRAAWLSADSRLLTPTSLLVVVFPQLPQLSPLQELVWVWRLFIPDVHTRSWEERGKEQGPEAFCKTSSECLLPLLHGPTVIGRPLTKRWQSLISHLSQVAVWFPKGAFGGDVLLPRWRWWTWCRILLGHQQALVHSGLLLP